MDTLINIAFSFNQLLEGLFHLLPDSPFSSFITFIRFDFEYDILGMVNWFIPFDMFEEILKVWLAAMTAYFGYSFVQGTLASKSELIEKIFKFIF